MYNRYIPQPDGSYRRSRMPDPPRPAPQQSQQSQQRQQSRPSQQSRPEPVCPPTNPCPPPKQPEGHRPCPRHTRPKPPPKEPPCKQSGSVTGFLKQLLPRDFDTGDLFVVLLLLLMAADCDDQNTALLTLALYFFM